jgi:hypothetical protein
MKTIRSLHFYLGIFFAPSIIFFAFSGALQAFGLHEGDNHAKWIESMGEVHKNQRPPDWMKKAPQAPAQSSTGQHAATQTSAPQQQPAQQAAPPASPPNAVNASAQSPAVATSAQPATSPAQAAPVRRGPPRKPKSVPFKVFSAVMAVGLILSSILGILIAFRMKPDPKPIWVMLVLGTILPMLLLYLN